MEIWIAVTLQNPLRWCHPTWTWMKRKSRYHRCGWSKDGRFKRRLLPETSIQRANLLVPAQLRLGWLVQVYMASSISNCLNVEQKACFNRSLFVFCFFFCWFSGVGIGIVFASLMESYSRNPSLKHQLFSYAILGFALAEAMGLFCLMVAFLILFAF